MYSMFTDLYLRTTEPDQTIQKMIRENLMAIIISVIFHTLIYWGFVNIVFYVFLGRWLSGPVQIRLILILVLIMFFGYFARYYHVQEIYRSYENNKVKTREHVDKLYIGWIFIG